MGSILGVIGSIVIGGVAAAATVVGVVSSQTSTSGPSPANVQEGVVVQYGSN